MLNHGIDQAVIDRVFAESRRFFELPLETKIKVALKNRPCLRGYDPLLAQDDCGGPEVENAAGNWIFAEPVAGTFVVSLGGRISRWTNDSYHYNMYRVYNMRANRGRYSMASFFSPDVYTRVACVPACLPERDEPNCPPCTAGERVAELIRRSYAKQVAPHPHRMRTGARA